MFAKSREKAARLEQTRLEKRPWGIELAKEIKYIPISSACPPLTSQKEMRAKGLVSLEKLLSFSHRTR